MNGIKIWTETVYPKLITLYREHLPMDDGRVAASISSGQRYACEFQPEEKLNKEIKPNTSQTIKDQQRKQETNYNMKLIGQMANWSSVHLTGGIVGNTWAVLCQRTWNNGETKDILDRSYKQEFGLTHAHEKVVQFRIQIECKTKFNMSTENSCNESCQLLQILHNTLY